MRFNRVNDGSESDRVGFPYKTTMGVSLICPKCEGETELRGTMDAWYLTWCPGCERIWRVELWTLIHEEDAERKFAPLGAKPVTLP
jgi:hypothetical protein